VCAAHPLVAPLLMHLCVCVCLCLCCCLHVQEVWYQLSFEGYAESDAEWFPASRIRAEHPQGDELIAAFDKGLEASGQGDVALPPHAAERAAALTVGTPQVGMWAQVTGVAYAHAHMQLLFQCCSLRGSTRAAAPRTHECRQQVRECRHAEPVRVRVLCCRCGCADA
jgi:hypothetical protein